ncbi:helix-turn-helix transcriptional regulator [Pseudoflavonifractor sp. DSM 107456]|uniref:Helix-turn-helix transcriptional regulator n=1 Tax=Pseudoflavonifractor gallinarum TaxID=2779352 RepID=A0ABR9R9K2_9FIRM|nr:helix-turn-helix transcriptional regulator [Pseudoflavonifractor gallinarum]MBE5055258.1 helix-turn-helix transcriptional regulator [Pseudoflavonifractor gallinarum]
MDNRIKELRKELGLTQQEFSDRIGVKRNTIAQYESGRNAPIDAVVCLICREFNVNEEWLRTGNGEMFMPKSRNEALFEFVTKIAEGPPDDIRSKLLSVMSRLTEEQWELLDDMAHKLADEVQKEKADSE